jgi:GrpB-like predicted nucleotidyltransferase (UPF0157 family)
MMVTLVEKYNPQWPVWFEQIKISLGKRIAHTCIRIEHVGSTAIPGMVAKPIIDIILIIEPVDLKNIIELLVLKGYLPEGDLGIEGREAFKLKDSNGKGKIPWHHLYVCAKDSAELQKEVAFRDYLRQNKKDAQRLSDLKWSLSEQYNNDHSAYMQGKATLCEEITQKALSIRQKARSYNNE